MAEVEAQGFDLDRRDGVDNQLGRLLSALDAIGLETAAASADAFLSGELVVLHSIRADSLAHDGSVTWRQLDGFVDGTPRFDGTDTFHPTSDAGLLTGAIADGVLTAGGGDLDIRVPFFPDQPPIVFPLRGVQVELSLLGPAQGGRIGGAIDAAAFDAEVLPVFADQVLLHMARNPDHQFTTAANNVFDLDDDGVASADEIIESAWGVLILDLDRDGDGDDDALSMAIGFAVTPAAFEGIAE